MNAVDKELLREIRAYTRFDGKRETFRPIRKQLDACRKDLSTPGVMYKFDDLLLAHGRAPIAILLACTLRERSWRLDGHYLWWADFVLSNAALPSWYKPEDHSIIDDLHPTRIFEYAGEFLRLTSC